MPYHPLKLATLDRELTMTLRYLTSAKRLFNILSRFAIDSYYLKPYCLVTIVRKKSMSRTGSMAGGKVENCLWGEGSFQ